MPRANLTRAEIEAMPESNMKRLILAALSVADRERAKADADRIAALPDLPITDPQDERTLQRLCEQELSRRGVVFLHLSYRAREKIGWPDLVFCYCGKACAVELKSEHGKLSFDQERTLAQMGDQINGWHFCEVFRDFVSFKGFLDMIGGLR